MKSKILYTLCIFSFCYATGTMDNGSNCNQWLANAAFEVLKNSSPSKLNADQCTVSALLKVKGKDISVVVKIVGTKFTPKNIMASVVSRGSFKWAERSLNTLVYSLAKHRYNAYQITR